MTEDSSITVQPRETDMQLEITAAALRNRWLTLKNALQLAESAMAYKDGEQWAVDAVAQLRKEVVDALRQAANAGTAVVEAAKPPPELKPMLTHDKFSIPQHHKVTIEIGDTNHLLRTIRFAEDNGLAELLGKKLLHLLQLFAQTRGPAIPRKTWEPQDWPQQYEPGKCQLWPDGYVDPGFGWTGAGMSGGLIFHPSNRDWSIHT